MSDLPLLHAIYAYRAAWNTYLAASLLDDSAPVTYLAERNLLEVWVKPAGSFIEAEAALRLALEEYEMGDCDIIPSMMKAAHGWMMSQSKSGRAET